MHRTIGYLSKRFTQIRPGEGRRVLLTFLYFFLIITAYYLIKPVSRSLILGELGSRMVPYVDLIAALLMGPVVTLFARLVDRIGKQQLVRGSFWAVAGLLLFFRGLLSLDHLRWVAGVFYVWVAIFSVLVVTLFWLVANDLYRPREAKRLFGFIGSGGILGGIVGSSIAAVGAQVVGTENLLLLSAGVLVLCGLVVQRLWALVPARVDAAEAAPAHLPPSGAFFSNLGGFARMLMQSRYLLLLVAMVGLNKLVATLVYYQLNPFIEQTFTNQDARTTFTGMFLGGVNTIAFIVQFFFTSWTLRRWGVLPALLVLPIGLLTGSVGLILWPVFGVAAATELFDGSLNYSLQQTTKEVLYLPIDRSIRYKVKPFIDMVVFRFGKGIAAIIGIVCLSGLHLPPQTLSYIVIPMVIAWLLVSVWLRRDYVTRIRVILQARAMARRQPDHRTEPVDAWLDGRHSAKKLALIDRLIGAEGERSLLVKELVAELSAYETLPTGVVVDGQPFQLKAVITDQAAPMAKRRQAIHKLSRTMDQATVDYLLGLVLVEEEAVLRHEAVRGLLRLRLARARLDFSIQPIRRQVVREVANYQRILHVAGIYRQHLRQALEPDDPVFAMLQVLMEESVEQIFHLLMLLYRPEDIRLIYEQLRADEGYLRADAIELLDNLVDPFMRSAIFPILDEDRFLELDVERGTVKDPTDAYRLLQGAIWDHNCWLSVTTLCAVGRLRLTTMRQELERATGHSASVVSKAAQVALLITGL
jgi:ATP/ADP translocase